MNISSCDGKMGVFIFDSYYQSMKTLKQKSKRWDLFEAIYEYSLRGIEPDLDNSLMSIFLVVKPFIDSKKGKLPRGNPHGKSDEERRYGACKKEKSSEDNSLNVQNYLCDYKEASKSGGVGVLSEKSLLENQGDKKNELTEINTELTRIKNNYCENTDAPLYNENKNKNKNINHSSSTSGENTVPTLSEVEEFIREIKSDVSADQFYHYYDSMGWVIRGRRIKDWRACVLKWDKNNKSQKNNKNSFERSIDEIQMPHVYTVEDMDTIEF